jgi:hypothetical protein
MALTEAFKNKKDKLILTSVKPHIGHLDVASGIASFIKTCLCLYDGILPHTLNFRQLNSMGPSAEDKVQILQKYRKVENRYVMTAGVTSLGMGGTNIHVILESTFGQKSYLDTSYKQFNLEEYVVTLRNVNGKNQKITEENDIDKLVRNAWSQILGAERLSAHDNFFDLGGNSFSAVQCIGTFPDKIKKEISVIDFLMHPTLNDFISHLKSRL